MSDIDTIGRFIQTDDWHPLRRYTIARIALGRTGISIPLHESLQFKLAHANARDAVYASLDHHNLLHELACLDQEAVTLHSQASSREQYLQRPDWGRRLNEESVEKLKNIPAAGNQRVSIVLADGLSATAINRHAIPIVKRLQLELTSRRIQIAPVTIVEQGRVAIGDEIGFLMGAALSIVLIGERPGLSSPDSLGAYLTYNPGIGLSDNERNCVSNIRPEGLTYEHASLKIAWLAGEILARKISGVALKENMNTLGSNNAITSGKD